jgi:septum site-determining protein MinD
VDSPAGIEQGFRNACAGADSAIVVTTPEVSAIRDADRVVGLLSSKGIEARLIINRIDFDMVRRGDMLSVRDVQDILGVEILGVIERDEQIIVAANCGEPVTYNPKSKAGQAFTRIAGRVCGESIPIPNLSGGSLWGRITRKLGVST